MRAVGAALLTLGLGCGQQPSTAAALGTAGSHSGGGGHGAVPSAAGASAGSGDGGATSGGDAGSAGSLGGGGAPAGVSGAATVAGFPASRSAGTLKFDVLQVQNEFWGEDANLGDLDQDGHVDVINGPWAWAGPDFATKWQYRDYDTSADFFKDGHYDPYGMADSWASYVFDVNGDGKPDPISKGHPGRATVTWYQNTGKREKLAAHPAADQIALEQNLFLDVTGDGKPELVAARQGRMGFLETRADEPWPFRAVSEDGPWGAPNTFFHGVGVGDMNQDGRLDVLHNTGWDEQPAVGSDAWTHHDGASWPGHTTGEQFGGAHMFGYDIDGDGDGDMVTSLNSHGYGLAWWEQAGGEWKRHLIFGGPGQDSEHPEITISQVHAIALADMDGDGLLDVVTGKSYWAHPDAPGTPASEDVKGTPYLYVFRLVRQGSVMFEPHLVGTKSGVGRQFAIGDVNDDGVLDIVVGNKLGTFVYHQQR